jgi:hypothetical protein
VKKEITGEAEMIDFDKIRFPRGMNLHILLDELPTELALGEVQLERLKAFITKFSSRPRKERVVVLPSDKLIKKLVSHYYLKLVSEGRLRKDAALAILAELGIDSKSAMRFWTQRNRELLREQEK